jgi:SAM-dependent methyltransferase
VLDVGCGTGEDVRAMAQLVTPGGRAVGLDLSTALIDEARQRSDPGPGVEFIAGDIYALPFADGAFDAVRADRVFQHLDEPLEALREMLRVTRAGGRVAVTDVDWGAVMVECDQRELFIRIQIAWHTWRGSSPGDPWSGRRLYNLFRAAGLTDHVVDGQLVWSDDLTRSDQIAGVLKKAHQAHEVGAISAAEVATWEQELRMRDAEGRFFGGGILVTVSGVKP